MLVPEKMSVLIVDDMENMCRSIRSMLKILKCGASFRFAYNGRDGWKVLQKERIDFAIIDWNMPIMTGVELLTLIRADKKHRDMPVIMITAEATSGIVAEAAESEIDAYLLKPLTVKTLDEKIKKTIDMVNNPSIMQTHLINARDFLEKSDFDEAKKACALAIKADPLSSKPLRILGQVYYQENDYNRAKKCFKKAVSINHLDIRAIDHLGKIAFLENDIDTSIFFFEKAVKINPRHIDRGVKFGKILVQTGKEEEAIKIFDRVINYSNRSLKILDEIIDTCCEFEVNGYAIRLIVKLLKEFPDREDLIYKLGVAYENTGEHGQAIHCFLKLESKNPDNMALQLKIAKYYLSEGKTYKADDKLHQILKADPENEEAVKLLRDNV